MVIWRPGAIYLFSPKEPGAGTVPSAGSTKAHLKLPGVFYIRNTNKLFTPGKFLFNTFVSNIITVEQITGIVPDYQSDKFSISEVMSEVRSLLETQKENPI
jgi:hypothetical protein